MVMPSGNSNDSGPKSKTKKWVESHEKKWRFVKATKDVEESLEDLRDLCFRPPEDPDAPHLADRGCCSSPAGLALTVLEALYYEKQMKIQKGYSTYSDTEDLVRNALGALYVLEKNPERHLYKPVFSNDPPPRNPNISLATVASRLSDAVERDFAPEVEALKQRLLSGGRV
jgi:hypothetical protein